MTAHPTSLFQLLSGETTRISIVSRVKPFRKIGKKLLQGLIVMTA